ncbi:gamma-gliadin-like [Salvia miltiorrhiza]|uniref:gamma-gliadin-like n=1 Tax=Salvia miltiorrhiza TaxID=226208 RepID=UPI0025AD1E18|nr:gamma-gliadin-like [Salvia miltiorrhiza]
MAEQNIQYMGDFSRPVIGNTSTSAIGSGSNQGNQFRRPPQQFGYQNQQQFYPPQQQFPFPQQQTYPQAYQQQQPQQYQQFPMQQGNFQQQQQYQHAPQQFQKQTQPQNSSLEDTMKSFMEMTKQSMESQSATIKRLETTEGQLSGTLNQMQQQQQPGKHHGQGLQPHQAQAVTVLCSGKVVNNKVEAPVEEPPKETHMEEQVQKQPQPREEEKEKESEVKLHKAAKPYKPPVPYPSRLKNEKLDQ